MRPAPARSRRDLSQYVFHFTKDTAPSSGAMTAFDVLKKILRDGELIGGKGMIKGRHQCVCFTEAPITELAHSFPVDRYKPYGIAVNKTDLYELGGRPVIYQNDNEYSLLPKSKQHLHVRYEPPTCDFTWEREWRIKTNSFSLSNIQILIIVPSLADANKLNSEFTHEGSVILPIIPLDLFGIDYQNAG